MTGSGKLIRHGGLELAIVHTSGQSPDSMVIQTTIDGPRAPADFDSKDFERFPSC
jgi:hypothetical protein